MKEISYLIADRETTMTSLLSAFFGEYAGHPPERELPPVAQACGEENALKAYKKQIANTLVDFVICSYKLTPGLGVDLAKKIRAITPGQPIIMISGKEFGFDELPQRDRVQREIEQYADAYLQQPFKFDVFKNCIDGVQMLYTRPRRLDILVVDSCKYTQEALAATFAVGNHKTSHVTLNVFGLSQTSTQSADVVVLKFEPKELAQAQEILSRFKEQSNVPVMVIVPETWTGQADAVYKTQNMEAVDLLRCAHRLVNAKEETPDQHALRYGFSRAI